MKETLEDLAKKSASKKYGGIDNREPEQKYIPLPIKGKGGDTPSNSGNSAAEYMKI